MGALEATTVAAEEEEEAALAARPAGMEALAAPAFSRSSLL